jgi:hypothetical protein
VSGTGPASAAAAQGVSPVDFLTVKLAERSVALPSRHRPVHRSIRPPEAGEPGIKAAYAQPGLAGGGLVALVFQ